MPRGFLCGRRMRLARAWLVGLRPLWWGSRVVRSDSRQPLEPARQVPVPVAEELHRRWEEHSSDDRRVDQDCGCQSEAELFEVQEVERDEHEEHADHHYCGACNRAGGARDASLHSLVCGHASVDELLYSRQDE